MVSVVAAAAAVTAAAAAAPAAAAAAEDEDNDQDQPETGAVVIVAVGKAHVRHLTYGMQDILCSGTALQGMTQENNWKIAVFASELPGEGVWTATGGFYVCSE